MKKHTVSWKSTYQFKRKWSNYLLLAVSIVVKLEAEPMGRHSVAELNEGKPCLKLYFYLAIHSICSLITRVHDS